MKLKKVLVLAILTLSIVACNQKQKKETVSVDVQAEKQAVENVMKSYKDAIQSLTGEGTLKLFTKDATVFESGGVEGTFENYLSHHLGPELIHFNSFVFLVIKLKLM